MCEHFSQNKIKIDSPPPHTICCCSAQAFAPSTVFPAVVHFPGTGHWSRSGDQHCIMIDVVRRRYPLRLAALGFTGASGDWGAACNMVGADGELAELESAHAELRALTVALAALGLCCAGVSILAVHFRWRASALKRARGRGMLGAGESRFELIAAALSAESDDDEGSRANGGSEDDSSGACSSEVD